VKLTRARIGLAVLSLAAVGALVVADLERTSPGPLGATHAQVPELADAQGCALCHGTWRGSMADACTECHGEIGAQLAGGRGFHAGLGAGAEACGRCHVEHHGAKTELAGALAFRLAGVGERAEYDHAGLDFGLVGAHAALACTRCHTQAEATVLARGTQRFLGLSQACSTCHADPHQGSLGASCADCHGQERPFAEVASFEHDPRFPLTGAHALGSALGCVECHPRDSERSVEALRQTPLAARGCAECHESPHSSDFVAGAAAFAGTTPEAACARCHDAAHGTFIGPGASMPSELHAAAGGFALDPPHDEAACADCHAPQSPYALERGAPLAAVEHAPRRAPQDCAACHRDPHAGQFAGGPFADAGCVECHAPLAFEPHRFDAELHARAAFALTGSHRSVACAACHRLDETRQPPLRVFHGTSKLCSNCHADVHRGAFRQGCATCHGTERFSAVASFDHDRATGFALDGAHARAECAACHGTGAPQGKRALGFVAQAFPGPAERCETCHADVHAGAFAEPAGSGKTDCAGCHGSDSFRALVPGGFDHARSTGFALAGAHARAACAACHGLAAAGSGRTLGLVAQAYPGPAERCDTCHTDVHAGAFAEPPGSGRTDCASCHGADSFRAIEPGRFDHAGRTGFALAGAHERTACVACHVPSAAEQGARRLGHAAGTRCTDCHADPHAGQFAAQVGMGPRDCAACHAADLSAGGFDACGFDHGRDARFRLDARHARLACGACHVPWPVADGHRVVRYRPLGTECRDCHQHGGDDDFYDDSGRGRGRGRGRGGDDGGGDDG
jgi:hypothetical protein